MKKLISIIMIIILFTACTKEEHSITPEEENVTAAAAPDKVNIVFTSTGELISFDRLEITEQLYTYDIYGYYKCEQEIRRIKEFATYNEALAFLIEIAETGYYIENSVSIP